MDNEQTMSTDGQHEQVKNFLMAFRSARTPHFGLPRKIGLIQLASLTHQHTFHVLSSVTPLSARASLVTMKSSAETIHAQTIRTEFCFFSSFQRLFIKNYTSGRVHNSNSIFSIRSTTTIRGFEGEQMVGSKFFDLSKSRRRSN